MKRVTLDLKAQSEIFRASACIIHGIVEQPAVYDMSASFIPMLPINVSECGETCDPKDTARDSDPHGLTATKSLGHWMSR
jgi:hypothetical protein